MKYRILKSLKSIPVNDNNIFGFDVETYQIKKREYIEQKFLMGSVVGDNITKTFRNSKDMAEFILNKKMFRDSKIFASNLEFDFEHTFKDIEEKENMFFIDRNGLIYVRYNKGHQKLEFIDTYNYTGKIKLEKMGKWLNFPKFNKPKAFTRIPKNKTEWDEMEKYNIIDSTITQKFGKFMQNFCNSHNIKLKITLASLGLDFWRRNYQDTDLFQERKYLLKKHYMAFHGGRTEVFKRGLIYDAYYYDFNSHYPSCCADGVDGKGSYPNPNSVHYLKGSHISYIENFEGVSNVKVKTPDTYIPLLGIKYNDKFVFPNGTYTGWFTHIELRKAIENGYEIISIYESIYYSDMFIPFRNSILDLYAKRKKAKSEGNDILQNMYKLMMNGGIFGKFAQKIDDRTQMHSDKNFYADDDGYCYINEKGKLRKLDDFIERGSYIYEKVKDPHVPVFVNPILSTYTTSLARLKLWEYMDKRPDLTIYCDTDSIITKKPVFENSNELGDLKLEFKIQESIFILPKFYYIKTGKGDIFKSKGVGEFIKDREKFNNVIKNKVVNTKRFTKIKESGVRKIPFSSIIDVNKNLNMEDNKRIWNRKFNPMAEQDSKPLLIS